MSQQQQWRRVFNEGGPLKLFSGPLKLFSFILIFFFYSEILSYYRYFICLSYMKAATGEHEGPEYETCVSDTGVRL